MTDSYKKKLLINIAVTLGSIMALLAVNFLINSSISKKLEQIQNSKRELGLRAGSIEAFVLLTKDAEIAEKYSDFLKNLFPSSDEIITFRRDLQTLASSRKLNFTFAFTGEPSVEEEELGYIAFKMSVGGKPEVFNNFLLDLESTRYVISFDAIDFTSTEKSFTARFEGKVFLQ